MCKLKNTDLAKQLISMSPFFLEIIKNGLQSELFDITLPGRAERRGCQKVKKLSNYQNRYGDR